LINVHNVPPYTPFFRRGVLRVVGTAIGGCSVKIIVRALKNTPFRPIFSLHKSYGSTSGIRFKRNRAFFNSLTVSELLEGISAKIVPKIFYSSVSA
jgi:hypothetical protein